MERMSSNGDEIENSNRLEDLRNDNKFDDSGNNNNAEVDVNGYSANYLQENFNKIYGIIGKIESEKLSAVNHELTYLRHVLDYQNSKIEKLTSLMTDFLENKNQNAIISSLQAIQEGDIEQADGVTDVSVSVRPQVQGQHQVGTHVEDQVRQVQDQVEQQVRNQVQQHAIGGSDIEAQQVHIDSNMDPALHHVAVAAVAAQAQQHPPHSPGKARKRNYSKRREVDNAEESAAQFSESLDSSKRPKISIDFLHNPMTVKEIYDEFTKGFRGQPPLCEMDSKYGKHEWRGDSRSKESKRFQRRKKLCDSIARGMQKYDKPAEEIIRYIEEFRGDKSLTWVMNGNLPPDLLS